MFMLTKTHERILREERKQTYAYQDRLWEFEQECRCYRDDALKYRAQRDAANKRKRDARKAAKVAK